MERNTMTDETDDELTLEDLAIEDVVELSFDVGAAVHRVVDVERRCGDVERVKFDEGDYIKSRNGVIYHYVSDGLLSHTDVTLSLVEGDYEWDAFAVSETTYLEDLVEDVFEDVIDDVYREDPRNVTHVVDRDDLQQAVARSQLRMEPVDNPVYDDEMVAVESSEFRAVPSDELEDIVPDEYVSDLHSMVQQAHDKVARHRDPDHDDGVAHWSAKVNAVVWIKGVYA